MNRAASDPRRRRRSSRRLAAAAAVLAVARPGPSEVRAASLHPFPGIRILGADEILRDHVERTDSGALLLVDATGGRVLLVTATDDPAIANPGDGAFHPVEPREAETALHAMAPDFLEGLCADVYLLPYPRAGTLSSSSDSLAVYLSPGTHREATERALASTLAHEVGHLVQRRILPRVDAAGWRAYRELRGIEDTTLFRFDGPHADRPQEIFAEDFRVLFGGPLARGGGSIENGRIAEPENVPGLAAFLRARLVAARGGWRSTRDEDGLAAATASLYPNPVSPGGCVTLAFSPRGRRAGAPPPEAQPPALLEICFFDAAGRRLARERSRAEDGRLRIRLPQESATPAHVLWVRVVSPEDPASAVTLPVRLLP